MRKTLFGRIREGDSIGENLENDIIGAKHNLILYHAVFLSPYRFPIVYNSVWSDSRFGSLDQELVMLTVLYSINILFNNILLCLTLFSVPFQGCRIVNRWSVYDCLPSHQMIASLFQGDGVPERSATP